MKKIWVKSEVDLNLVDLISKSLDISPILAQIVINRGIKTVEEAKKYLFPTYSDLYDPFLLNDMDKAVDKIIEVINRNKKIFIYGDYDVDGVTSTVLLMLYFKGLGYNNIDFYIPSRFEGYGLNTEALQYIKDHGGDLVITVDCGISAIEHVDFANKIGLQMIITDHHEPSATLPNAYAVINPKRLDSNYPFRELAGVGVAYKLAVALQSKIQNENFSRDLREFLDIVAFGSIADIVPLKDENRFIVKEGLKLLNDHNNLRRGFKQLVKVAGIEKKEISAGHVGFYLAPRINALGRLSHVKDAIEMFLSEDDDFAMAIAKTLNAENKERQDIEKKMIDDVLGILPKPEDYKDKVIVLANENWHTGVKGIVASKILEIYYKPVILCNIEDGNIASGSARSIPGFDIKEALDQCKDLLISHGGHSMAAGLKVDLNKLDEFKERLNDIASNTLTEEDFIPKIKCDYNIGVKDITFDLIEQLELIKPFGHSNPSPVFTIEKAHVVEGRAVGSDKKHLKLKLQEEGYLIDGIAFDFGHLEEELQEELRLVDVACALGVNEWQGRRTLQVEVKDLILKEDKKDDLLCQLDEIFKKTTQYIQENSNPHKKKTSTAEPIDRINNKFRDTIKKETSQKIFEALMNAVEINEGSLATKIAFNLENGFNCLHISNNRKERNMALLLKTFYEAIKNNKLSIVVFPTTTILEKESKVWRRKSAKVGVKCVKATHEELIESGDKLWQCILQKKSDIVLTTVNFLNVYKEEFIKCRDFIGFISYITDHERNFKHDEELLKELAPILNEFNKATFLISTNNCNDENIGFLETVIQIDKVFVDVNTNNKTIKDNRNFSDKEGYIVNILQKKESAIVYTDNQDNAMKLFENLKKKYPSVFNKVGLITDTMNIEDQQLIENTFKEKRISILITDTIVDIGSCDNIIFYNIPKNFYDFATFIEYSNNVHLIFHTNINNTKEEYIDRDFLTQVYLYLFRLTNKGAKVAETSLNEIARNIKTKRPVDLIKTALSIFEELKLLNLKESGEILFISTPIQEEKRDLLSSNIYKETLTERERNDTFKKWIENATITIIANTIVKTMFPVVVENI